MIIAIDWNNTLQDQIGEIIRRAELEYGKRLSRPDFAVWNPPLGRKLGWTEAQFIDWAWNNRDIQRCAPPFSGAARTLKALEERGHRLHIVSNSSHFDLLPDWMHYFGLPYHRLVSAGHKLNLNFDLLIEDNPLILAAATDQDRPVMRLAQPWNQDERLRHLPTLDGWNDESCFRIEAVLNGR